MKIKKFSDFVKLDENSNIDWSGNNWDERGQTGENPPNSGLEGSSAEPMDYFAGDYGETAEEDIVIDDDQIKEKIDDLEDSIDSIKAMVDDLTDRILKLEKNKKNK